ncbi:MAG: helix-turn-helix domain-containing protein [Bacteroidota bacterium]
MPSELNLLILIAGVSQGFFFAALLLFSKKYRSRANKYLAIVSAGLAIVILRLSELIDSDLFIELFEILSIPYLLPAFLFFYLKASIREQIVTRTYMLTLLPAITSSLISILISIADIFDFELLADLLESIEDFELYAIILFAVVITFIAYRKVQKSNLITDFKNWLYIIFFALMTLMLLLLLAELSEAFFQMDFWEFAWSGPPLFLMTISYFGVQQVNIEQQRISIRNLQNQQQKSDVPIANKTTAGHYEKLKQLMDEKELYKFPDLNREMLALELGVSASTISRILKNSHKNSLYDFVNQYRVTAAKNLLDDPKFDIFSLEAIGKEVGFKSRSAFYDTFKKSTGLTPGKYKKRQKMS